MAANDESKIHSLIAQWEMEQASGRRTTPEELCKETPELLDDLRKKLGQLHLFPASDETSPFDDKPTERDGIVSTPKTLPTIPNYRIEEILGRGGMGVVYKAVQLPLNRTVALKMILSGEHASPDERLRFLAEAESIAKLQHPGIVQIYDFNTHGNHPFFAMEYLTGGSLDKKLNGTPLPPKEAALLVQKLAEAMQAAHEQGIVHRDLKPANILLTSNGQTKITDFGLAKTGGSNLTATGKVVGTPSYMSPEQAAGKKGVGPATDIYALGAILYECLVGRPPFKAETPIETILQVIDKKPIKIRKLRPTIPSALETICHKCLQKDIGQRYGTSIELADDLGRFIDGKPIHVKRKQTQPHSLAASTGNWFQRIRLSVVVFISLVLLISLFTWNMFRDQSAPLKLILLAHYEPASLNSPANLYGAHGVKALEAWADDNTKTRQLITPPDISWKQKEQTAKDWLDWLISEGKKAGDIVIYYFGMPGHADAELGPFLWLVPSGASSPEARHKLFVNDLLDKVQNDLKRKKVFLIFDASQVDHSIVHGMVTNDFSRSLHALDEKVSKIPDCYILNSCNENQLSWTSPELGMSIFSYYLSRGLCGAARETNGRPNISIKNLYDYVASNTDKWTQANRSAMQKPFLLPTKSIEASNSIEVASIPRVMPKDIDPIQRDDIQYVIPDWDKFYQLAQLSPAPEIVAPYQWKTYTALLLQLEKLYFAGAVSSDISAVRRRLDTLANFITEQSKSPTWTKSPVEEDINAPDTKTREKNALLLNASYMLYVLWKSDNPATTKEDIEKWRELVASTKYDSAQRKQLLIHSWRWTIERVTAEPNLDAAERVLALIEEELRPRLRPSDVHFVRMLVRDTLEKPWSLVRTKSDLIKKAIDIRTKSERIAWLGSDTGASYAPHWVQMNNWIAPEVKQADDLRRSAEDMLFDANESQWALAVDRLNKASELYTLARSKTQSLITACQLRDQLYFQLPYYSNWAAMQSGPLIDQATQAWAQLHQLAALLQSDQKMDDKLIGTRASNLRKLFNEIQSAYLKKVKEEIRDNSVSTASAFLNVSNLLQQPLFTDGYEGTPADKAKAARDHRVILLNKLKDASYRLNTNAQQPVKILETASLYQPDRFADARLKLAYAQLGEEAIQLIRTSNVTPVILNWSIDRRITPQEQTTNLMQVSSKVGIYWSVLPLAMMKHKEAENAYELMQATGTASTIGPAEKWISLAAQFNRQLDPGTSEPIHKNNQLNAIQTERWYFTHRFILGQANRSQEEGWADLQPNDRDYSTKLASIYLESAQELLGNLANEKSVEAKDKGWHALVVDAKKRFVAPPGKLLLTIDAKEVPKRLFVTDESFVKFAVGMKTIGTSPSGYPVIRVWSPPGSGGVSTFALNEKMVPGFRSSFSKSLQATSLPVDEVLVWMKQNARLESSLTTGNTVSLRAMLLHRGHLYENADIQISITPR